MWHTIHQMEALRRHQRTSEDGELHAGQGEVGGDTNGEWGAPPPPGMRASCLEHSWGLECPGAGVGPGIKPSRSIGGIGGEGERDAGPAWGWVGGSGSSGAGG